VTTIHNNHGVLLNNASTLLDAKDTNDDNVSTNKETALPKRWESGLATETYLRWTNLKKDTIPTMVRHILNGADEETIVAVNTIIEKEAVVLEKIYDFTGEKEKEEVMVDVGFYIRYNNDKYITAYFGGELIFESSISIDRVFWPIMIDLKNKKRLILSDIVKIDSSFVATIFNEIEDMFHEESNMNINELRELLVTADISENGHIPSFTSYFDANKLFICFPVIKHFGQVGGIELPLSKISTMMILPNFPIEPE